MSGGVRASNFAFVMELLGLFFATDDADEFADKFTHSLALGAQLTSTRVRPPVFYSVPLDDDFEDVISGIIGVRVEVLPR